MAVNRIQGIDFDRDVARVSHFKAWHGWAMLAGGIVALHLTMWLIGRMQ